MSKETTQRLKQGLDAIAKARAMTDRHREWLSVKISDGDAIECLKAFEDRDKYKTDAGKFCEKNILIAAELEGCKVALRHLKKKIDSASTVGAVYAIEAEDESIIEQALKQVLDLSGVSFSEAEECDHNFKHEHTNWYKCTKCEHVTTM